MSCSSFWNEDDLVYKSIPTLQDLLACCDEARFVNVVMEERVRRAFAGPVVSPKRRREAERKLEASLETMLGLPTRKKANRSMILLPAESFVLHAESGLIERAVSAQLVSFDCAPAVRRVLDKQRSGSALDGAKAAGVLDELPQPVEYALAPWEDTLAARMWLGGPWCCRERYLALSSAFWEMTYYGFEYDRAHANQVRQKARLVMGAAALPDGDFQMRDDQPCRATPQLKTKSERAVWYGLDEPERFDVAYRDRLVRCVGSLNQIAQLDFWRRFEALARQLGKG